MTASVLLLMMCLRAKWCTIASTSTPLSKYEKLAIFIAKLHSSSSVMEWHFTASGSLLLVYAVIWVFHSVFGKVYYPLQTY